MKNVFKIFAIAFLAVTSANAQKADKYKCMVQMSNYPGEGAYIVVSLVNPKGEYEQTLYVLGRDKKWYPDLKEWWKFQKAKKQNISAITGASMAGGDRSVNVIEIESDKVDAGYTLRFEAAVENQKYNVKDLEVPLTTENVSGKVEGTNYIRYVRLAPNN
ncbi:DUF2271 domain-containing protein [Flavobacterium sp. MAH-1]|uniref:DUF2271 domain-containing protein n=1 Tax=Flavobacterium agri TaxID=2743471 RepID=A0A7Y8Y0M1_9FLAO|nr:DUF2271 domain-containing protein [Flavobacterium agri]NUY80318.1 DUF2271 domain-containing protein [Flavobacterium agri]NYA70343.1 DUF2271 domain-containing protein [Flavobacterium agri]